MRLVPITVRAACAFIAEHHRHNRPPRGAMFALALEHDGRIVGVATVGRPVSRVLASDPLPTCEVTRTCTSPTAPKGAVSKLYSHCGRAAQALGWKRCVSYTLQTESGASLRGAGWQLDLEIAPRPGWSTPSRPRAPGTVDDTGKRRWRKDL